MGAALILLVAICWTPLGVAIYEESRK